MYKSISEYEGKSYFVAHNNKVELIDLYHEKCYGN